MSGKDDNRKSGPLQEQGRRADVDAFIDAASRSPRRDIDAFLGRVQSMTPAAPTGKPGRLIFAMDATASREPSWDRACHLQAEMFTETSGLGGLEIQLAYYRGFGEFRTTDWLADSQKLLHEMVRVRCLGGMTQIGKLLAHAASETRREKVQAVVFVGDAFEEDIDVVCHNAGELGVLGVPVFCFHEGGDPLARRGFEQIARLTRGAYCPFDGSSARQLRELLGAVAVYAAGGRKALESYSRRTGGEALRLTHRITR